MTYLFPLWNWEKENLEQSLIASIWKLCSYFSVKSKNFKENLSIYQYCFLKNCISSTAENTVISPNFHSWKLGETTVFFAVFISCRIKFQDFTAWLTFSWRRSLPYRYQSISKMAVGTRLFFDIQLDCTQLFSKQPGAKHCSLNNYQPKA